MGVSRGKQFEQQIKDAAERVTGATVDRFPDPMAGYAGVRNICDFGVYRFPHMFYLECKAISGNTLNFASAITPNQWLGLTEKAWVPGVVAGVLVWFIDHDLTAFVPIQSLNKLRTDGAKSLNIKDCTEDRVEHYKIPAIKKRVLFEYDLSELLSGGICNGENKKDE